MRIDPKTDKNTYKQALDRYGSYTNMSRLVIWPLDYFCGKQMLFMVKESGFKYQQIF